MSLLSIPLAGGDDINFELDKVELDKVELDKVELDDVELDDVELDGELKMGELGLEDFGLGDSVTFSSSILRIFSIGFGEGDFDLFTPLEAEAFDPKKRANVCCCAIRERRMNINA